MRYNETMMLKTINGKSKEQVAEELSRPFDDMFKENTYDGYVSVSVQRYRDRLDEVVGPLNYNVETIDTRYTDSFILKTVAITITYDDGSIAAVKHGDGGAMFVYPQGTAKPKSPENTNESAASDAFKRACKLLRIGLDVYHQNRIITGKESELSRSVSMENTDKGTLFKLIFTSPLIQDGTMKNSFHAEVRTSMGETATLVIWENDAFHLGPERLNDLVCRSRRGEKAKLYGYFQIFGNQQYKQIIYKGVCDE